jgi:HK97 family phage portal protein
MGLFGPTRQRAAAANTTSAADFIASARQSRMSNVRVDSEASLTHSAVWACIRLRAGLVSSMPIEIFKLGGSAPSRGLTPFLKYPGGSSQDAVTGSPNTLMHEWLYSSQADLDMYGNCFGVVTMRDSLGYPARVELVPFKDVSLKAVGSRVTEYTIEGKTYDPKDIWHERQYTVPGTPLGLSPLVYGAASMSGYLSAQQFGVDFFRSGAMPSGVLSNNIRNSLTAEEVQSTRDRFKAAASNRDIVVLPAEWEYKMFDVGSANEAFLKEKEYGVADVCRFFDVPADLIDAPSMASNVTYANVSQRNLQLLTIHIGPALYRRECALSASIPGDEVVRFRRRQLLAMDPQTEDTLTLAKVKGKILAPSEARAAEGRRPFTVAQIKEFELLGIKDSSKGGQ